MGGGVGYVDMGCWGWYVGRGKGGLDGEKEKKYEKGEMGDDLWYGVVENVKLGDEVKKMLGVCKGSVMGGKMVEEMEDVIKRRE